MLGCRDICVKEISSLETKLKSLNPQVDIDVVRNTANNLETRWKSLQNKISEKFHHLDQLLPDLEKNEATQEKCKLLGNRLKIIHKRVQEIGTDVDNKTNKSSAHDLISLSTNCRQVQSYLTELEALQAQAKDIEQELLLINYETPETRGLKEYYNVVNDDILDCIENCKNYLNKLQNLTLLVKYMKEIDTALSPIEKVLNEDTLNNVQELSSSQLKHQERLYAGLQQGLQTYEDTFNNMCGLVEDTKQASMVLTQDRFNDPDAAVFTGQSDALKDRWEHCRNSINQRLALIRDHIPMAEQMENNRSKHRMLLNRLDALKRKLDMLEKTLTERSISSVASETAAIEIVMRSLQSILGEVDSTGRQLSDLHADIDEACQPSERPLPETRDLMVKVQELRQQWVSIQSLSSAFMNKLKNIQALTTIAKVVDNVLKPIEKILRENESEFINQDSGSMKRLREILISLQGTLTAQQEALDELKRLGLENNEICEILTRATKKQDPDFAKNNSLVKQLVDRWESVYRKLISKVAELDEKIPAAENFENNSSKMKNISAQLTSISRRVDQVENSLVTRLGTRLPEDPTAIEIVEHAIQAIITEFTACIKLLDELSPIMQEMEQANNIIEFGQLKQTYEKMYQRCNNGIQQASLYLQKLNHLSNTVRSLDATGKLLRNSDQVLSEFDNGLVNSQHAKEALNAYSNALDNLLKNQHIHDKMLEYGENTGKVALELGNRSDPDKLLWFDKVNNTKYKWDKTITDLKTKLAHINEILPKLEQEEFNKFESEQLLMQIIEFLRELGPIESQQKYELQSPHNDNKEYLNSALNKQKEVVHRICESVEPRFRALSEKVEHFLTTVEHEPNSKLSQSFEQLKTEWSTIWTLTSVTINKLKSLINLSEQIEITRKIIEEFRSKLSNIRYTSIKDDEMLNAQMEILSVLSSSIPIKDPEFGLLNEKMDLLKQSLDIKIDQPASPIDRQNLNFNNKSPDIEHKLRSIVSDDRDIQSFGRVVDDIQHRWNEIKNSIDRGLNQLQDRKDFNERLKFDRGCNEISNVLRRWINQVDTLISTIKQRASGPSPCQEQEMAIQRRENQNIAERLDDIYPQIETVLNDANNFVKMNENMMDNKAIQDIITAKDSLKVKCKKLAHSWELYQKKINILDNVLQNMKNIEAIVARYECELVGMSSIPQHTEMLRKIIELLEKLQSEVPIHDPEFVKIDVIFKDAMSEIDSMNRDLELTATDQSIKVYQNEISLLKERWNKVKQQLFARLQILYEQLSVLEAITQEIIRHNEWLDDSESKLANDNMNKPGNSVEIIQNQIQEHLEIMTSIEHQLKLLARVEQQYQSNMNTALRYKEENSRYAAACNIIEKRSTILTEHTEIEITRVRKRYDKMNRIVRERVERLKVCLENTRRKEVSIFSIAICSPKKMRKTF